MWSVELLSNLSCQGTQQTSKGGNASRCYLVEAAGRPCQSLSSPRQSSVSTPLVALMPEVSSSQRKVCGGARISMNQNHPENFLPSPLEFEGRAERCAFLTFPRDTDAAGSGITLRDLSLPKAWLTAPRIADTY